MPTPLLGILQCTRQHLRKECSLLFGVSPSCFCWSIWEELILAQMKANPTFPDGNISCSKYVDRSLTKSKGIEAVFPSALAINVFRTTAWTGTCPSVRVSCCYLRGQWLGLVLASRGHVLLSDELAGTKFLLSQSNIFEAHKHALKATKK